MAKISSSSQKRFNRKQILLAFISLVILIAIITTSYLFLSYLNDFSSYNITDIKSNDRILVFAPHPDDESLGVAGVIKKALENNATVTVVVMTDGSDATTSEDFSKYLKKTKQNNSTSLVELRHEETLSAMEKLGLNSSNVIFLGYPDTSLKPLFEDYWDPDKPYKSNLTFNNYDHSPYNYTYEPGIPYTGSNVAKNLEDIMEKFKPTIIITTDGWDEHSDHWATHAFVMYSAALTHFKGKIYTYMIHKGNTTQWPSPAYYEPSLNLTLPSQMQNLDVNWTYVQLTATEEKAKENAINSYNLPLNLTNGYIKSFIRTNEIVATHNPVQVQKVYNNDFFRREMPSSSFKDIRYDYGTKTLKTSDEMSSVGLAYDTESFYVIISAAHNIKGELVYKYHFRFMKGDKFKRLDIKVKDGKAEYENKSSQSVIPDINASYQVQGNMTVLKLPLSIFANSNFLMMNVDVSDSNEELLDSMAWRQFELKNTLY